MEVMTEEIIKKLSAELDKGITTEVQVVYLLAGIRKLIERDGVGEKFSQLKFHCDWALHSMMDRAGAKAILKQFDTAHPVLRNKIHLHELPGDLRNEINRISQMKSFKEELAQFLEAYNLPFFTRHRSDGWVHFLHLYTRVIEDIPLTVTSAPAKKTSNPTVNDGTLQHITKVTVHFEFARESVKHEGFEDMPYKVTWRIFDKSGESGEIFILNSFSLTP